MGVGIATAEFLVEAAAHGASFERTATIGRQNVFVGPVRLARLLRRHGRWPEGLTMRAFLERCGEEPRMLDPFLGALGAQEVQAVDASPYEGAEIVHDLNEPVGEELEERFSLVFDGGSLEHVFNVPVALASYMRMVEVGGHLVVHTMANNCFGHGFYQFSPELFFRALSPENGYEVERVVVLENDIAWRQVLGRSIPFETAGRWYEVRDPAEAGTRVEVQNSRPLVMQVLARRTAAVEPFAASPQQSDYTALWSEDDDERQESSGLASRLPAGLRAELMLDLVPVALRGLNPLRFRGQARWRSLRNRRFFRRVR